jgi:hypothetical protein
MAGPTSSNYDVTADGQRFLMIQDTSAAVECKLLRIVSNWSNDLQKSMSLTGTVSSSRNHDRTTLAGNAR